MNTLSICFRLIIPISIMIASKLIDTLLQMWSKINMTDGEAHRNGRGRVKNDENTPLEKSPDLYFA